MVDQIGTIFQRWMENGGAIFWLNWFLWYTLVSSISLKVSNIKFVSLRIALWRPHCLACFNPKKVKFNMFVTTRDNELRQFGKSQYDRYVIRYSHPHPQPLAPPYKEMANIFRHFLNIFVLFVSQTDHVLRFIVDQN